MTVYVDTCHYSFLAKTLPAVSLGIAPKNDLVL
jgi:hypothetical protein